MTNTDLKPGMQIKYRNWGTIKTGEVIRTVAGKDQVFIVRLDGPMAYSPTWIHVASIISGD